MELAFIVLNYKNVLETKKCVDSIKKLSLKEYLIVIVENGSQDGSNEELTNEYATDDNIKILSLENNIGFSGGNNAGYEFVRKNYNPEYVVVTNNDVLFPQIDFYQRIHDIYKKTPFDVLGPDIFVRHNNEHQSPIMLTIPTYEDMKKELSMYEYYRTNPKKWVSRRKVQNLKNRLCQSNKVIQYIYDTLRKKESIDRNRAYSDVCVQGACIIISNRFLKNEEKMFTPEPFLYCEELLLFIKCKQKNYKILYEPSLKIFHEDSSTMKKINKTDLDRAKFTLEHHVIARKLVLECLKK